MKNKIMMIVVALVALAAGVGIGWFFLGSKKPAPIPPESYVVGDVTVPALTREIMPELVELDTLLAPADPSDPSAPVPETEEGEEKESGVQAYQYRDMENTAARAEEYAALLTGEELGFEYVDDRLFRGEAPEAYEPAGDVYLALEQPEQNSCVLVKLSWDEKSCTVALEPVGDRIHEEARRFTSMETITYLRQLEPSELGLSGDTMDDYRIYTMSGGVLVDGRPCIPVNIYYRNPDTGTNEISGLYYLASDERRIYREDPATGTIRELLPHRSETPVPGGSQPLAGDAKGA